MLPAEWKPVPVGPLLRIGSRHDGGYTVPVAILDQSRVLVSMGLCDDWSFEEEFNARTGARVLCYDGSVTGRFWVRHARAAVRDRQFSRLGRYFAYRRFFARDGIQHIRDMVGDGRSGTVSLPSILSGLPKGHIYLKCDIEGSEYQVFDDLVAHADWFTGIAMELHDVDVHRESISKLLRRLPQFLVADLHANNYGTADAHGDPTVLEIALVRSDLADPAATAVPNLGDRRNNPGLPELELRFAGEAA